MPAKRKATTIRKSLPARKSVERKSVKTIEKKTSTAMSATSFQKSAIQVAQMKTYVKNPRFWVGVVVIVVAVLVVVFKGLFVAAVVNGQPISRLAVISQVEKQNGKQALDNLVVESLVMQEAQKRHITVTQSDMDGQIKKIEDQLKGQGVTLDDALSARGLSRADLTDQLKVQEMLNKMVTAPKVTDADIQSYIDKNQDSLPKDLSDADLKSQVKSQLEQQQLQNNIQSFVANLQKNAKISYFVDYPASTLQ